MINIQIELSPDKEPKKGIIDPEANFEDIKASIVESFHLGNPKEYRLMYEPSPDKTPNENKYQEGDLFVLIKKAKKLPFTPQE